ncbi:unnamed protein product [Orchesella dallaii]|uniref:Glycoside hydrolase family 38 N-terminal domain-containing protein n=1 Tax=Orchesella dallaii TaxID=48710 RepID=A0ABP1QWP4_9HEXA
MSIPKRVFLKFRSITCVLTIIFAYLSNVTTLRLNDPFQSRNCKPKSPPDFDSVDIYPQLNFTASWTTWGKEKHFWTSKDFDFEERYENENPENSTVKPSQVQVFVLPYSHNDPGWLQTFEGYFYSKTKQIINNAVIKLSSYENMTFAWSEISFLSKWWDEASTAQKDLLKKHVKERRLEILTGGWVMSDESCSSFLGLLHQLVEGHQWIKQHLSVTPNAAWSIDPFGHGSTMPYILKAAGIDIMVIQVKLSVFKVHEILENVQP